MTRSTHTYVVLKISPAAYNEISEALRAAGYDQAFMDDPHRDSDVPLIDMHGIALDKKGHD